MSKIKYEEAYKYEGRYFLCYFKIDDALANLTPFAVKIIKYNPSYSLVEYVTKDGTKNRKRINMGCISTLSLDKMTEEALSEAGIEVEPEYLSPQKVVPKKGLPAVRSLIESSDKIKRKSFFVKKR